MSKIKKLDQSTILKLAAGEIIDRPVSIVKELIENSIDAGATQLKISTTQGGIAEIKVADNGGGILASDLTLTIAPHATSKLADFNDLERVESMGFRGEALASISEVADITIQSWNKNDEIGCELIKKVGAPAEISSVPREQGTTICVQHLFKKIPVRFRFLKSQASESNVITRLVQQFSLHYPNIRFEYMNNDVNILTTTGNANMMTQFAEALKIKPDDVISFAKKTSGINVFGVITAPNKTFKQRSKCWFSVNGRMVKSPLFYKAVDHALSDVIPKQCFPALVCHIECKTEDVDINIHPKKEDVKFLHQDDIFLAIKRAVQSAVYTPSQTWASTIDDLSLKETSNSTPVPADINVKIIPKIETNDHPVFYNKDLTHESKQTSVAINFEPDANIDNVKQRLSPNPTPLIETKPTIQWLTFKNKYIIVPLHDHVLVFDQHAVHERILYDRFKEDFENNALISMPLLMPEYIEFSKNDAAYITTLIPIIRSIGLDFDVFDETTFVLREVPQFFSSIKLSDWLSSFLTTESIQAVLVSTNEEKVAMLQMKACKAAVKAGQRLHDQEIKSLIETCVESKTQYTCPHGRPLFVKMTEQQLDALFLRS